MLYFLLVIVAAVPTTEPWWAAHVEHVLIAWGSAFIVSLVPTSATIVRGMISHREHVETKALTAESVRQSVASRESLAVQIEQVHTEVKTGNALRLGELADAAETRRIAEKAPAERTAEENAHIDMVPSKD